MIGDVLVVDIDEAASEVAVVLDQPVTNSENIHAMPHPDAPDPQNRLYAQSAKSRRSPQAAQATRQRDS
jgi:hypothetical protein